ncbi:glycosyltransferase family 2 protein [Niabella insulamsoli]|uniref:glycosyltransferase family 2 protein n=1 Tax=Niabella insulamsoli TaxID=3144874 RepID=UPI0031FBF46B
MFERNAKPIISVLVSTYNWPQALNLCLLSIENQSEKPFEVIIADDGSTIATKELIDNFRKRSSLNIKHVWHEDKGFRLAKIRNMAIAQASGDYIVQVDGDIILHRHFIKDHKSFAKKNSFVRASRIYINELVSEQMIESGAYKVSVFSKGISNFFSGLRIPFIRRFFEHNYKVKGLERYEIHGCNMAYWRADAIEVNGYNEAFEGWGPEDKEFVVRMLNSGKVRRFLKGGGIAFHLYHKESSRAFQEANQRLLDDAIGQNKKKCKQGIDQYLK